MRALIFALLIGVPLSVTIANAQQQQISPAQMALAIDQAVGQLAQQAEAEKTRADQLQQQVASLQKQLADLQAKTTEKR